MRNKILATMLIFASFSFAQFGTEENNAFTDNNSVYTDNASNSTSSETPYYTNSFTNNGNQYYTSNPEAQDPYNHAHRGFFFSPSITFGRTYFRHTYTDYYDGDTETYKYKGYQVPQAEIRLGGTIAGTVTVYGSIGLGVGTGTFNNKTKDIDAYNYSEDKNYDATNIRLAFAAGLELYPVHDKESAGYGLFLGAAAGFAIEGAFFEKEVRRSSYYSYYDETVSESEAVPGLFLRFEFGKDWWFARRWCFGVSFNYTVGGFGVDDDSSAYHYEEKDEYVSHLFGFTLRLAH